MPAALVHTLHARDGTLDVPQSQSIDSQGQGSADETALLDQLHDLVDAHLMQAIVAEMTLRSNNKRTVDESLVPK